MLGLVKALNYLILFHSFLTWCLVGLIWVIQWLHYPSFLYISRDKIRQFSRFHQQRITHIVMPLMLLELITGLCLLLVGYSLIGFVLNFFGIVLVWIWTFWKIVPLHSKITKGQATDLDFHKLIQLNWFRTFIWTVRGIFLLLHKPFLNLMI